MKFIFTIVVITVIFSVAVLASLFFSKSNSIPVLTRKFGQGTNQYYLYVPGERSTCVWKYTLEGKLSEYTTHPSPETGEHSFLYNSGYSNMFVSCLNSNGKEYAGDFSGNSSAQNNSQRLGSLWD